MTITIHYLYYEENLKLLHITEMEINVQTECSTMCEQHTAHHFFDLELPLCDVVCVHVPFVHFLQCFQMSSFMKVTDEEARARRGVLIF